MAEITVYSYDDLTTLERAYTSDPIDMPESETMDRKEYVLSSEEFMRAYNKWDRDAHPLLELRDELSDLRIWLSQPQAERLRRAIDAGKDSVDLSQVSGP